MRAIISENQALIRDLKVMVEDKKALVEEVERAKAAAEARVLEAEKAADQKIRLAEADIERRVKDAVGAVLEGVSSKAIIDYLASPAFKDLEARIGDEVEELMLEKIKEKYLDLDMSFLMEP